QAGDPARAPPEPPGPPLPRAPIDAPAPDPANTFGVYGRFAYRRPAGGPTLEPVAGFSLGASIAHRYATLGSGSVELGAGLDLFHDRFSISVLGSSLGPAGTEETFD